VALLGILDNAAPTLDEVTTDQTAPERSETEWLRHIAHRIAILARVDLRLGELATDDHSMLVEDLRHHLIDAGLLPPDIQPAQFRRFIEIYKANARAAAAYRPGPLPTAAGALVVRASDADAGLDQLDRQGDPALGWRPLLGDPAQAAVPGTHLTMFVPPNHHALAQAITAFGDRN
jgi:thioesterase domain-containing protein